MFAAASAPVERPDKPRSNSYHSTSNSAYTTPVASRSSSVSSLSSPKPEHGQFPDRSRNSSIASTTSVKSNKSGFRSLFGKKDKEHKGKKNTEKIVLTSKYAAAVKTKMMMDAHNRKKSDVKTAGITQSVHTGHLSAAQQEARHPHSGPPALHPLDDMPILTRIASGDEVDEEDVLEQLERARLDSYSSKLPEFSEIPEHRSDESANTSADHSADESEPHDRSGSMDRPLSPNVERALRGSESRRPIVVAKNSYGGRFHKDDKGNWKR